MHTNYEQMDSKPAIVGGRLPHYGPDEQSRQQEKKTYCPNKYTVCAKVMIEKSRGEVSLLGQDTIENVS